MTEEEHKNTLVVILSVVSLAFFAVLIALYVIPEEPYPWTQRTQDQKPLEEAQRVLDKF